VTWVTDVSGAVRDTAFIVNPLKESTMFKSNVGSIDRILRIVVGLVLIGLTLAGSIGPWGWIGVVPLLTGALKTCPLYSILGLSTCPVAKR
jgi:hypothetical protein